MQESKYAIGVLRAIGMKNKKITSLNMTEVSSNIIAASTIEFILGRFLSAVAMSVLTNLLEIPIDTRMGVRFAKSRLKLASVIFSY